MSVNVIPLHPSTEHAWKRVCDVRRGYREGFVDPCAAITAFSLFVNHPHLGVRKLARLSLDEVAIEDNDPTEDIGAYAR